MTPHPIASQSRAAAWLVGAVILQAAFAPEVVAQAHRAPRVFVEGFRVTDSTTRRVAAEVRTILPKYVSPSTLAVMPSEEIGAFLGMGQPDDFGSPWTWADLRTTGRVYRVDEIVDIVATVSPDRIVLHVSRLRPLLSGVVTPLPPVAAKTMHEAVRLLAKQLVVDSVLLSPAVKARFRRFTRILRVATRKLVQLDNAQALRDLGSPPSNRLEALRGDRAAQHSIRINDQFRLCFIWTPQGPTRVEIVDYH